MHAISLGTADLACASPSFVIKPGANALVTHFTRPTWSVAPGQAGHGIAAPLGAMQRKRLLHIFARPLCNTSDG